MKQSLNRVSRLKEALSKLKPLHDTPFGRLHPYWARKPLNVVREIIKHLSQRGEIVADPFMGCGTTVFASLLEKRNAVGWDINPLSTFIVRSTLELSRSNSDVLKEVEGFFGQINTELLQWFVNAQKTSVVERERFSVLGDFEYGRFKLIPTEIIVKSNNGTSGCRSVHSSPKGFHCARLPRRLLKSPVDFQAIRLQENARIAIPKGARLSHFFSRENQAAINLVLQKAEDYQRSSEVRDIILFMISTSIPLLRFSDYKASSQWPYWRPRERLTSRNPIFVFKRRYRELLRANYWLKENMGPIRMLDKFQVDELGSNHPTAFIETKPFQRINTVSLREKFDLIVTDPPYGDHVPYLEYSSLWNRVLQLPIEKQAFELEIVKSDAANRRKQSGQYVSKIKQALEVCSKLVKPEGFVVWFYQDSSLKNWAEILKASRTSSLGIQAVIPISKQRRSMKTVTSPGGTFDGDLILVFRKGKFCKDASFLPESNFDSDVEGVCRIKPRNFEGDRAFFMKYAFIIQKGFEGGWLPRLADRYDDVRDLLAIEAES